MEQTQSQKSREWIFEGSLWRSRFIVLPAVVASLVSSVILFLWATADVARLALYFAATPGYGAEK